MRLKETAASQSHFNDVCALIGHPTPTEADPHGTFFAFETSTEKAGAYRGRADVWYRDRFIWEYKGAHADLQRAYQQLLLYREALGNPPLLITSDTRTIFIHTNFTGTVKEIHDIPLERLLDDGVDLLKRAFNQPDSFKPTITQQQVTQATSVTFAAVTDTLKAWDPAADPVRLAHFVIRLLFCLFAEDTGLLPDDLFTKLVAYQPRNLATFSASLSALFAAMRQGGVFGPHPIPMFDGTLFDDDSVPTLPGDVLDDLGRATLQDWSAVDPSIFGTLFERAIDPSRRAQLGAHYTSRDDILLIVEPVLMRPLRDRWQAVKAEARTLLQQGHGDQALAVLRQFSAEIAATRVLDPAPGSGNFLYVALRQLLDLQKEVITFAGSHELEEIPLTVSPHQLYGIELDPYAHQLAQVVVWIGYIQWRFENGFPTIDPPILRPLHNIQCRDAILAYDAEGRPVEPEWPDVDVVIGNPPFLGDKKMRAQLGGRYVEDLRKLYAGRIPGQSDLCCYWFEKARAQIARGQLSRAGLLATNSIRTHANRRAIERIKATGDIFMAWSDRPWLLDGASVRVSMVGFDHGIQNDRTLDGCTVQRINPDLTSKLDLTTAVRLPENAGIAFQGPVKVGSFELDQATAAKMLTARNRDGSPNSDVVRPWMNALDLTRRPRGMFIIDFAAMSLTEAQRYEAPIQYVEAHVKPDRDRNRRQHRRDQWWLHGETVPALRDALFSLHRYICTPRVAKHRLFVFVDALTLPDNRLIAVARSDDYFLGTLQSRPHEVWSLALGSTLEDRPFYTPTSTFETFPFPWPPGREPAEDHDARVAAIAQAARDLVALRDAWLNPPAQDIGVTISQSMLNRRTLTNLYNDLDHYRRQVKGKTRNPRQWDKETQSLIPLDIIEELDHIHTTLDHAVLDAYGWPHTLTDDQILEHLLALNLERAQ
jgi:hypothetical protein